MGSVITKHRFPCNIQRHHHLHHHHHLRATALPPEGQHSAFERGFLPQRAVGVNIRCESSRRAFFFFQDYKETWYLVRRFTVIAEVPALPSGKDKTAPQ